MYGYNSCYFYRPDVLKITYSRKKFFVELRPSLVSCKECLLIDIICELN